MELKTRKRLSILILVIGMPAYVVAAVSLMNWLDGRFGRQPIWIELLIYVALGVLWALPFKRVRKLDSFEPFASSAVARAFLSLPGSIVFRRSQASHSFSSDSRRTSNDRLRNLCLAASSISSRALSPV